MTPADVEEICGLLVRRWDCDPADWQVVLAPLDYQLAVDAFAELRDSLQRRPTVVEFTDCYRRHDPSQRTRMSDEERLAGLAHLARLRAQLRPAATRGSI